LAHKNGPKQLIDFAGEKAALTFFGYRFMSQINLYWLNSTSQKVRFLAIKKDQAPS